LSSRGWFFQEKLLSPRIIHFSPKGVFLEDASGVLRPDSNFQLTRPTEYEPCVDNKLTLEDLVHSSAQWYHTVEKYSSCELSMPMDRLPAIEGLAIYYSKNAVNVGEYACGIWGQSVHQGLLWILGGDQQIELDDESRGIPTSPSWSWARWSGKVLYPQHLSTVVSEMALVDLVFPQSKYEEEPRLRRELDPPSLSLNLVTVEWENVSATRLAQPQQAEHFPQGPIPVYQFDDKPGSIFSLDGANRDVVHFDKIILALTSRNVAKRSLYDEEAEKVIDLVDFLYYFLLLQRVSGDQERYHRVGLGWISHNWWWWWKGRREVVSLV
jgi:hypothetical protein